MSVYALVAVHCKCPLDNNLQCACETKLHTREANWPLKKSYMTTCSSGVLQSAGIPNIIFNVDAWNKLRSSS